MFAMVLENTEQLGEELKMYYQDHQLAVDMDKVNIKNEIIIQEEKKPEIKCETG